MLVLVREDGGTKITCWWNSEISTYSRRVNGKHIPLTRLDHITDILHRFPNSQHCNGMQNWAEAGRQN
jgi:hypothetical protein